MKPLSAESSDNVQILNSVTVYIAYMPYIIYNRVNVI